MLPIKQINRNPALWVAIFHTVSLVIGFSILASAFNFPEVLRFSAEERFRLFLEHQTVIQPTYWLLTITGFSQIALAIVLCSHTSKSIGALFNISLISGILTGLLQAVGFVRWVFVIPFLANESIGASTQELEWLSLIEGAINSYIGMALGEHLANICLGIWCISTSFLLFRSGKIDRFLQFSGIALGVVAIVLAAEQLGLAEGFLDIVVDIALPAWLIWICAIAYAANQTNYQTNSKRLSVFILSYTLLVIPSFL